MSEVLKIRLWIAWVAILIFVLGQMAYNHFFFGNTSKELLDAYSVIDAQLTWKAELGRRIFGATESLCFVLLIFQLREIGIKNLALNIAYGFWFFLSMAALSKSIVGVYYIYVGFYIEFGYAVSGVIIALIELYRGKHS